MKALESISVTHGKAGEVDLLIHTLQKEGAQRRNSTRGVRFLLGFLFAIVLAGVILDFEKGKPFEFGPLLIVGSLLGGSCAYGLTPGHRKAVTRAAKISDKRLLGGIIEALDSGEPKVNRALQNVSIELLEQVTSEDFGLLDDYQLEQLARAVRTSTNEQFCKAAVRVMGSIGTNRTLRNLEIFLNDPSISERRRSILEPRMRAAMAELRIRLAKKRLAQGASKESHLIADASELFGCVGDEFNR